MMMQSLGILSPFSHREIALPPPMPSRKATSFCVSPDLSRQARR